MGDLAALPEWPARTVAVLSTGAGAPHAIPVSTIVRAGPRALLFALSRRRESLARLRADPRCAMTILCGHDVALTVLGAVSVVEEPMEAMGNMVALRLDAERIQDHDQDTFEISGGIQWRWTDEEAAARDAQVRAGLRGHCAV